MSAAVCDFLIVLNLVLVGTIVALVLSYHR
jgi:hypothetical protein